MSDFLDRVVLRTLGEASMLSPRLPSLFEPAGHAGAAVTEESLQAPTTASGGRAAARTPTEAHASQGRVATPVADAPMTHQPAPGTVQGGGADERIVVVTEALASSQPPPLPAGREPSSVLARAIPAATGELQPLSRTMRVPHVQDSSPPPTPRQSPGELLPPGQPVFATRQEGPAGPPGAIARPSRGLSGDASRLPSEPVVHVSIGRLEVRAAPSHAPTPRPSPAARRSALDDYLRQRDRPTP